MQILKCCPADGNDILINNSTTLFCTISRYEILKTKKS